MAGGFHSTRPWWYIVAFVASVTSKFPSALKIYLLLSYRLESWLPFRPLDSSFVLIFFCFLSRSLRRTKSFFEIRRRPGKTNSNRPETTCKLVRWSNKMADFDVFFFFFRKNVNICTRAPACVCSGKLFINFPP